MRRPRGLPALVGKPELWLLQGTDSGSSALPLDQPGVGIVTEMGGVQIMEEQWRHEIVKSIEVHLWTLSLTVRPSLSYTNPLTA